MFRFTPSLPSISRSSTIMYTPLHIYFLVVICFLVAAYIIAMASLHVPRPH